MEGTITALVSMVVFRWWFGLFTLNSRLMEITSKVHDAIEASLNSREATLEVKERIISVENRITSLETRITSVETAFISLQTEEDRVIDMLNNTTTPEQTSIIHPLVVFE